MSSSFTDPFNEKGKDVHFSNIARQHSISNQDYVEFMNCITLTDWIQARNKALTDPTYYGHFSGGAFALYKLAAIYAHGEKEEEMQNTLLFFETLYVLAGDKGYTALCDFIDAIDADMVIMSMANFDVYEKQNLRCFGNAFRGLIKICLRHIPAEGSDFQEGEQHYWETILRKTYMVYRMIENQEGNAKSISENTDSESEESGNTFEQEFHHAYYYFESGNKVVMTNGHDWYWRDSTHHKWIENNDWERMYYDAAYRVIEIDYDEINEQVIPRQRK